MKKQLFLALTLATCLFAVGCGAGDAGKATPEDKANLDRLTKEGLQTGGPAQQPPTEGTPPPLASGEVAPP